MFAGVVGAAACGDDDDGDNDNGRAGTGGSSRGGSGTSGSAADAGSPDSGGSPEPAAGTGGTAAQGGALGTAGAAEGGALNVGGNDAGGAGGAAALALTDPQIALVLDTLNQGEVEVAYAALPHLALPDVQEYAQQMIADHGMARQEVSETVSALDLDPKPSAVQQELRAEAEALIAQFHESESDELDALYVDSQVAAHADALALLGALEEAADAEALQQLIATLIPAVQSHHDAAVALKEQIE